MKRPRADRRVQRTKRLLGEALMALLLKKNYDSITVQDILEQADIGRSTFYTHFRDKDHLLTTGLDALREQLIAEQRDAASVTADPAERAIAFSGFLFDHVNAHRGLYRGLGVYGGEIVRRSIRKMVKHMMTDSSARAPRRRSGTSVPPELLADVVASTFMTLMEWWLLQQEPLSAGDMNEIFRAVMLPSLRDLQ